MRETPGWGNYEFGLKFDRRGNREPAKVLEPKCNFPSRTYVPQEGLEDLAEATVHGQAWPSRGMSGNLDRVETWNRVPQSDPVF